MAIRSRSSVSTRTDFRKQDRGVVANSQLLRFGILWHTSKMPFYLGVDGGATKTSCAVGDEKALLGSGTSSGSNIVRSGEEQARASLQAAILKACCSAAIAPSQITQTCIGVAGVSVPDVSDKVRRIVAEVVAGSVEVVGDNEIAMEAAFGDAPGIVVASGTGSIAYGRNEHGEIARAGGHGFVVSDEGSGQWIGRAAVTAALRALDRDQVSFLYENIGKALHVRSRHELVKVVNGNPAPDFSQLFPVVVDAAEAGDAVAVSVLRAAGTELAQLAAVVFGRLWPNGGTVRVAMVGGVFQNAAIVRQEFYNSLRAVHPQVNVSFSVVNPVMGALALARKAVQRNAAHNA